jgi:hypothetical protein
MGGKIVFELNARVELTPQEDELVRKYGLGKQTVYDSAAREKHLGHVAAAATGGSLFKGLVSAAMSKLTLHVTIDSLSHGQHIEAKDLDELLGAETAIREACVAIRSYLDTAATFDGQEVVFDY